MLYSLFVVLLSGYAAAQLPEHPAESFEPSAACGCHAGLVDDWRRSMHSQALDDPLYLTKLAKAEEEAGPEVVRFCEECHGAIAAMAGELDDRVFSEQGGEGVSCDLCHQVTGTREPIGNTSLVVEPDGTKRAQFDDAVSPARETAYSAFHETAEFCGMCHNVDHPANGFPIEATYTEWAESPYAQEGIVCQDCHMTPGPGVTKPNPGKAAAGGPDRPHIYRMTFAGGNVALGDSELAEERLQAAAEIEFTATDAGGTETELGRREFHTVFEDAEGNYPVEMWDAADFHSDDRIPPQESVEETWDVVMPESGPLTLTATLYYRSCTEEFAAEAGVDVPSGPPGLTLHVGRASLFELVFLRQLRHLQARSLEAFRLDADLHLDFYQFPIAPQAHGHLIADRVAAHREQKIIHRAYRGVVERYHHIACDDSRLLGPCALDRLDDECAFVDGETLELRELRRDILADDAEEGMLGTTVGDQLFGDTDHCIDGDREPDAATGARLGVDGGVDPDETTGPVDERATGVTRVDRGVRLDHVDEGIDAPLASGGGQGAADRRDDP